MLLRRVRATRDVRLGVSIGGGGEGNVYEIDGEPDLVAKVYRDVNRVNVAKLVRMLDNPPLDPALANPVRGAPAGFCSIAWPIDLLENFARQKVGFLMPRVRDMRSLAEIANGASRVRCWPGFEYRSLHRTARNLARVVGAVHGRGYVIGDLNDTNVLVSDQALVTIIDTDSFQVPYGNGNAYRCAVAQDGFLAPEFVGKDLRAVNRTIESDCFALAVLIFNLLMMYNHPFDAEYIGNGNPPAITDRIVAGHFPHARPGDRVRGAYRPMDLPPFGVLHPGIQDLFWKCFLDGHSDARRRPTAVGWMAALETAERQLTFCAWGSHLLDRDNKPHYLHWYSNHLAACPWCVIKKKVSVDFFAMAAVKPVQKPPRVLNTQGPTPRRVLQAPPGPARGQQPPIGTTIRSPAKSGQEKLVESGTAALAVLGVWLLSYDFFKSMFTQWSLHGGEMFPRAPTTTDLINFIVELVLMVFVWLFVLLIYLAIPILLFTIAVWWFCLGVTLLFKIAGNYLGSPYQDPYRLSSETIRAWIAAITSRIR
jgi:DNA-binding helix-hairpin-helix protein with protein kinase domain